MRSFISTLVDPMELGRFFATNDRKTLSKTKLKEAVLKVQINLDLNNK